MSFVHVDVEWPSNHDLNLRLVPNRLWPDYARSRNMILVYEYTRDDYRDPWRFVRVGNPSWSSTINYDKRTKP